MNPVHQLLKDFISEDPDFCGYILQSIELLQTMKNSVGLCLWLFIGSKWVLAADKMYNLWRHLETSFLHIAKNGVFASFTLKEP